MNTMRILAAGAFATAIAVTTISAQQPQTQRVRGTIEKVDGNTLLIKAPTGGAPITLTLADNAVVVGVLKATVADIKEGSYIGSGAMPQPDGTQNLQSRSVVPATAIAVTGMAPLTAPRSAP
jgi:hypothetical protein